MQRRKASDGSALHFIVFLCSGGLGVITDGDTYEFLRWPSPSEPILLLFAFDSIKEFQSIELDVKCALNASSSCTLTINVGIFEIVTLSNSWTNRFRSITINNNRQHDDATVTHLILSIVKAKGQFVIIQINTNEGLALSEVTFHHRNEFDDEQDLLPSSIYIERNLRRLESLPFNGISDLTASS